MYCHIHRYLQLSIIKFSVCAHPNMVEIKSTNIILQLQEIVTTGFQEK